MLDTNPAYQTTIERRLFKRALMISSVGHLLLLAGIVSSPLWQSEPSFLPAVIDVQMVDVSEIPAATGAGAKPAKAEVSATRPAQKSTPETAESKPSKPNAKNAAKAEISIAKTKPKAKVAMKYKTFKSKRVIKSALEKIEKRVETSPPKPLSETIKRLREKVEKDGSVEGEAGPSLPEDVKGARTGAFVRGSKQEAELIDIYRTEIAYEINKNWAYADQLGGGEKNLVASIVIKVMPDGEIVDIFFVDRSGNDYLDDSAYKAVVKSNPVRPHPEQLHRSYVELGLRFGPEGVR